MTTLIDRLQSCRKEMNLTQAQLAQKCGLRNQSVIGMLESGRRKRSSYLPVIASVLGVEALWLAEGRGPKHRYEGSGSSPAGKKFEEDRVGYFPSNVLPILDPKKLDPRILKVVSLMRDLTESGLDLVVMQVESVLKIHRKNHPVNGAL